MGLVALEKRCRRASLPLLPCEITTEGPLSVHQETGPYQTLNVPAS